MKYPIKQVFLSHGTKRRNGKPCDKIKFLVAHDTGNEGSSARANVMYYEKTVNDNPASAHIFVDNFEIIECIPAFKNPERANHVLYNVETDDDRFGADANAASIGVEMCFGNPVNTRESYARFVWILAYLCEVYQLDPRLHIVGHFELDPKRKIDPVNSLKTINKTIDDLLDDVAFELELCKYGDDPQMQDILKRLDSLEKKLNSPVPDWAKSAVDSAVKKGFFSNVENGSNDFFRLIVALNRKGVF